MANGENKDWFYNNFIQTTFYKDFTNMGKGHLYCIYPAMETRLRHFAASQFLIETCANSNIFNFKADVFSENIKLFIDNGYYVSCVVDVSKLKGTRYTIRKFFSHRIMIFGYDFISKTLDILDFDAKEKINRIKISMDDFISAFMSDELLSQFNAKKNNTLVLYERKSPSFTIDLQLVSQTLNDYLNSYNTSKRYALILPCDESSVWGISTYSKIIEYLNNVSKDIDIRLFHAFFEHKKIMFERFQYFNTKGVCHLKNEIMERLQKNRQEAEIVKMLVMKYNLTYDIQIINNIIRKLKDIEAEEEYIYHTIISQIESTNYIG